MATAIRFKKIVLEVFKGERTFDLVNKLLADTYIKQGYDAVPKTKAEAGGKSFNGEMSSFTSVQICPNEVIEVNIMSTRYLFRDAVIKIAEQYGNYVARETSICMAHVSFIAVDMYEGKPVIIAQLKGDAVGMGQIHAGLVAGAITAKHLTTNAPLCEALKARLLEEIGLDISLLSNPPEFCLMVDERENGFVNIAAVGRMKLEDVQNTYLNSIKGKPLDKLQVSGLAIIPIDNASSILKEIKIFKPNGEGGGEWNVERRGLRPYTEAIIDWLADVKNQEYLIEKIGL